MTQRGCPFNQGDRIWAYCRDSGGEEQQDSVASQRRAIEEYCEEHNLILLYVYTDEGKPGSSTVGREGLEDLLYLARQEPRPVEGIIFWSFSRLARKQMDSQFIKSDLRRRGYLIHSMTDDVPYGEFAPVVEALIDWKNERYLKDLSRDVKRGLHDLAREGYSPGGFPPRGYKAEKVEIGVKRNGEPHIVSQWVPDPEIAPRVKKAFEMRASGASYLEIQEATQIYPVRGSYVTMFRNKTYLGIRKCGTLEVENAHEPLVSLELWNRVQETLRKRPKKGERWPEGKEHPRRAASPFLLSGIAICAECGAAMIGKEDWSGRRKRPYRHYMCSRKDREGWASCPSRKIAADGPENALLQFVDERALTLDFVRSLVDEVNELLSQRAPSLHSDLEETKRRLDEVDKSINVLLDLAEQFGAASAGPRLLEREAERKQLQAELNVLEKHQAAQNPVVSPETIQVMLREMRETLSYFQHLQESNCRLHDLTFIAR
jgi:site-specific DNA recombinase